MSTRAERNRDYREAVVAGLKRAQEVGYTKPYDVALAIGVELRAAGLKVVRDPHNRPKED